MEKEYYTVGEVSKLCDIPVRTLHYYDEIGLLIPAKKDGDTGYRYYAKSQLLHVNIIKQFKVQGYNIKEIKSDWPIILPALAGKHCSKNCLK